MIAPEFIGQPSWKRGVENLLDTIPIKHKSGGWSKLGFKSYDQGRKVFQGTAKEVIWLDEEAPEDVYGECLVRTATTRGIVITTFTPLLGISRGGAELPAEGLRAERGVVDLGLEERDGRRIVDAHSAIQPDLVAARDLNAALIVADVRHLIDVSSDDLSSPRTRRLFSAAQEHRVELLTFGAVTRSKQSSYLGFTPPRVPGEKPVLFAAGVRSHEVVLADA
jgi:phage terminase large subunit-like protein